MKSTERDTTWQRECLAGLAAACVALPFAIAAGVLVYSPLGPSYVPYGASVGLLTSLIAGLIAAGLATSSSIITGANVSSSLIPAGLMAELVSDQRMATGNYQVVVLGLMTCLMLAGVLQIAFGLLGVGRIIKFTPQPVLAGFVNSVAVLVIVSQLRPFIQWSGGLPSVTTLVPLGFLAAVVLLGVILDRISPAIPSALLTLALATIAYHLIRAIAPSIALEQSVGALPMLIEARPAWLNGLSGGGITALTHLLPHIFVVSATLATIGTLQALLVFRMAQTVAGRPPPPPRDLIAQGVANAVSALCGGISAVPLPSAFGAATRAGGRTRLSGIICALVIFAVATSLSWLLALIPVLAFKGILVSIAIKLFDRSSLGLLKKTVGSGFAIGVAKHALRDIVVIAVVMLVSVAQSIVAGAVIGCLLSCLIFIKDMSRPVVRRQAFGDSIFSKRHRSASDISILMQTAQERVLLDLQGVMFFGNADTLSTIVADLPQECGTVLLNMRGISDIDASGAAILASVVDAANKVGRSIVFCHFPDDRLVTRAVLKGAMLFDDLETALQHVEDQAIAAHGGRGSGDEIPLAELDTVRMFGPSEQEVFSELLTRQCYSRGEALCRQGDQADRMWLIAKGTVSVRLQALSKQATIASLAAGTTVGEMAVLEGNPRSATVVADGDVVVYELTRISLERCLREHPQIAVKLFEYFAREMARRVRLLDQDLQSRHER